MEKYMSTPSSFSQLKTYIPNPMVSFPEAIGQSLRSIAKLSINTIIMTVSHSIKNVTADFVVEKVLRKKSFLHPFSIKTIIKANAIGSLLMSMGSLVAFKCAKMIVDTKKVEENKTIRAIIAIAGMSIGACFIPYAGVLTGLIIPYKSASFMLSLSICEVVIATVLMNNQR